MATTTVHKNLKVGTGQETAVILKNAQNKFDELYANTEALESGLIAVEEIALAAGKVDTISVNGGSPEVPDSNKNIVLHINSYTVGLGNVKNVDTTNASNITSGTLAEARISGSLARVDGTNLEHYYTKTQVDEMHDILAGGLRYKGTVSATTGLATAEVGDQYKASAAFQLGSEQVDVGDLVIAKRATTAFDATAWEVVPSGDDGNVSADVSFPAGDKLLLSDGAGKKVKSSGKGIAVRVGTDSTDAYLPTAKAVEIYVSGGFVAQEPGKALSTNDYTTAEKNKLAGIEAGAQVNDVTGVKGEAETAYRTGQINITKANVGLGNVNNTADVDKPVSNAVQTALNAKQGKPVLFSILEMTWADSDDLTLGNFKFGQIAGYFIGVYNDSGREVVVQIKREQNGFMIYSDVKITGNCVFLPMN